jgi:hypothetical protein
MIDYALYKRIEKLELKLDFIIKLLKEMKKNETNTR